MEFGEAFVPDNMKLPETLMDVLSLCRYSGGHSVAIE